MFPAPRWLWVAPLGAAISACAGSDASSLEPEHAIAPTLAVSVCAEGDEVVIPSTVPNKFDLQVTGTVTEAGMGPIDPCPDRGRLTMASRNSASDSLPQTTWLRIQSDAGRELLLALAAPGFAPSIHAGDALHVEAQSQTYAFAPSRGWLELRDGNGQLLFWYGESDRVDDLKTPDELQLSAGAVQARPAHPCMPIYEQKQLDVVVDGASGSIGWSEQGTVGDWLVTNFGVSEEVSMTSCPDFFISSASAAIWPRSASAPP